MTRASTLGCRTPLSIAEDDCHELKQATNHKILSSSKFKTSKQLIRYELLPFMTAYEIAALAITSK